MRDIKGSLREKSNTMQNIDLLNIKDTEVDETAREIKGALNRLYEKCPEETKLVTQIWALYSLTIDGYSFPSGMSACEKAFNQYCDDFDNFSEE